MIGSLYYAQFLFLGWLNIYSASYEEGKSILNLDTFYGKQILWICLGFILVLAIMSIDCKPMKRFSAYIYLQKFTLSSRPICFRKKYKWRNRGVIWGHELTTFEFAKYGCSLAVAKFLSDRKTDLKSLNVQLKVVLLIFLQHYFYCTPDPGSPNLFFLFLCTTQRRLTYLLYNNWYRALVLFIFTLYTGFIFSLIFTISLVLILFAYLIYYKHKIISFQ